MNHTRHRGQVRPAGPRALFAVLACTHLWIVARVDASAPQVPVRPTASAAAAAAQTASDRVARPPAPATPVIVNRTTPRVEPPPLRPIFSSQPTDKELTEARVFDEPLVPIGRVTQPEENRALVAEVQRYLDGNPELLLPFWGFLKVYPDSPWRASLAMNIGLVYRRTGYFSRALETWESVWTSTKAHSDPRAKAIADRTLGELVELHARLGRFDRLEALLGEIDKRPIIGRASEQITGAREGLWLMRNRPDQAFRCGPLAIDSILAASRANYRRDDRIWNAKSTIKGTSLAQMQQLAAALDLPMQMAHRSPGASVLLPALVHWRAGHFAALIREENGRLLVRDPTFGDEMWISKVALDDEATGYVLVAPSELPAGWRVVSEAEGADVWGKGQTHSSDPKRNRCEDKTGGGCGQRCFGTGMPVHTIHLMLVSLSLRDIPVGYTPVRGPDMLFHVTYSQRESFQPQTFFFSHLGPKWTFQWLSYLEDDPANAAALVHLAVRGGGRETFQGFNPTTQEYQIEALTGARLVRTSASPIRYERHLGDGSVEVFAQPDGASTVPRRVFMTEWRDKLGNSVTFTYDAQLRLVAATDALGQVSTLSYTDAGDSRRITRVTDPFGRFATFTYDTAGRLIQIVDVIGLQSTFTYDAGDFIVAMTTPYGTTRFSKGENGQDRWLESVDPAGGRERVEYRTQSPLSTSDPASMVPSGAGLTFTNAYLEYRNSFYWDKRAMAVAPRDLASAHVYHWLHVAGPLNQTSGTLESERPASERRIWYLYPGQSSSSVEGSLHQPSATAQVLDDGTSRIVRHTYNTRGLVTSMTDPVGRRLSYTYGANGVDLVDVRHTTGSLNEVVMSFSNFTAFGLPQTKTDGAGQSTTLTYNTHGQVLTSTNAKSETTTYVYDTAGDGFLETVTGPAGDITSYSYDGFGRVQTVTNSDNDAVTTDYDALNRVTKVTYADGSYEEMTYDKLDLALVRDRAGHQTRRFYDALGRLTAERDPAGLTTTQIWCSCGSLDARIDAKGQKTRWERDLRGRVLREIRPDGATALVNTYESATGRLKTTTDAKGQVTTYVYHADDTISTIAITGASTTFVATATYDPLRPRLTRIQAGSEITDYTYKASGSLGAGDLATIDGPLPNDTITLDYDELGRVVTTAMGTNQTSLVFDARGRVSSETNELGTFTYTYDGVSERLQTVTYPNSQSSAYAYYGQTGARRLQTLHHRYPDTSTVSKFDLAYDMDGSVDEMTHQIGSAAPTRWRYTRDPIGRLVAATHATTGGTPTTLKRFFYGYDEAGNRRTHQIDDAVATTTYDALNRVVSRVPGGAIRFAGLVNEPASVTIDGVPADVSSTNAFQARVPVGAGTTAVTVQATDASGNAAQQSFEVDAFGTSTSSTYDANGNLLSDGVRTYEWNERDLLSAINIGTHRFAFSHDFMGRPTRIVETDGVVTIDDRYLVWCSPDEICEERQSDGTTVLARHYGNASLAGGVARYRVTDHLNSTRETTDGTAAVVSRLDYEPFGVATLSVGTVWPRFGFTGYAQLGETSVWTAPHRTYEPTSGRWISLDPARDESNWYAYASNSPIDRLDPDGLASIPWRDIIRNIRRGNTGRKYWGCSHEYLDCTSQVNEFCTEVARPADRQDNLICTLCTTYKYQECCYKRWFNCMTHIPIVDRRGPVKPCVWEFRRPS